MFSGRSSSRCQILLLSGTSYISWKIFSRIMSQETDEQIAISYSIIAHLIWLFFLLCSEMKNSHRQLLSIYFQLNKRGKYSKEKICFNCHIGQLWQGWCQRLPKKHNIEKSPNFDIIEWAFVTCVKLLNTKYNCVTKNK